MVNVLNLKRKGDNDDLQKKNAYQKKKKYHEAEFQDNLVLKDKVEKQLEK